MKALRLLALLFLVGMGCVGATAQIGYQVALLNSATGEARANEKVTVNISLSNSASEVFYTETKQATTNDFGVLSLTIGNEDTFSEVDLSKLPFFISVTVNGVLVGRTQVLTVPVAEAAKRVVPIDKDKIVGSWTVHERSTGNVVVTIKSGGTGTYKRGTDDYSYFTFRYEIEGNNIYCYPTSESSYHDQGGMLLRYSNGRVHWMSK